MSTARSGILLPIPPLARYLTFSLEHGVNGCPAMQRGRLDLGALGL